MKANELRIGNLIYNTVNFLKLYKIDSDSFNIIELHENDNEYLPIPLTEEWLLKFGFEKKNKSFTKQSNHKDYYTVIEVRKNIYTFKRTFMVYVHQLQNLYFALTSEELTINVS